MTPDSFDYDAALHACALGDQQALHRIYQHDGRHLLGVALRIVRRRELAEDVLHDAFVSIWHRAASFDAGRGAGRGWVFSVVRHQALNALRSREREVYNPLAEIGGLPSRGQLKGRVSRKRERVVREPRKEFRDGFAELGPPFGRELERDR